MKVAHAKLGTLEFELPQEKDDKTPSKAIPAKIKAHVIHRDKNECAFCSSTKNLHIHHITPRAEGGKDNAGNLVLVCSSCHGLNHEGYLAITTDPKGKIKFTPRDKQILTFTDLLFEKKREEFKLAKMIQAKKVTHSTSQGTLF